MVTWTYPRSKATSVHDGDTFTAMVDMGLDTFRKVQCRLYGCNARERYMGGGKDAKENLEYLILDKELKIEVVKYDKYGGRHDVKVWLPDQTELIPLLIEQDWLVAWDGKGEKPIPPWPRILEK